MKQYGTEVNEARAIPEFYDGLKPVQRKVLWAMHKLNLDSPTKLVKTARLVGDCFAAGTNVLLAGGASLPIEKLIVGDEVMTDTGAESVTNTFILENRELYEVTTENGTVLATGDQIFYCLDKDGAEVERTTLTLKMGDCIKTA